MAEPTNKDIALAYLKATGVSLWPPSRTRECFASCVKCINECGLSRGHTESHAHTRPYDVICDGDGAWRTPKVCKRCGEREVEQKEWEVCYGCGLSLDLRDTDDIKMATRILRELLDLREGRTGGDIRDPPRP